MDCTYAGPSLVKQGILFDCDDDGTLRQVDLQYYFWPSLELPTLADGEGVHLRAEVDLGEYRTILSRPDGEVLLLALAGNRAGVLSDQSDYEPFQFATASDVCPVDGCYRQFGLDVTLEGATTRFWKAPFLQIAADDGAVWALAIQNLYESTTEKDASCGSDEHVVFALVLQSRA